MQSQCERCGQWHKTHNLIEMKCKKCWDEVGEIKHRRNAEKSAYEDEIKVNRSMRENNDLKKLILWLEKSDSQGRFDKILDIIGSDDAIATAISLAEGMISDEWMMKVGGKYFEIKNKYEILEKEILALCERAESSGDNRSNLIRCLLTSESTFSILFKGSKKNTNVTSFEKIASDFQGDILELQGKCDEFNEIKSHAVDLKKSFESKYRKKLISAIKGNDSIVEYFREIVTKYQVANVPNKLRIENDWWSDNGDGIEYIQSMTVAALDEYCIGDSIFELDFDAEYEMEEIEDDIFQQVYNVRGNGISIRAFGKFKKSPSEIIAATANDEYPRDPDNEFLANFAWKGFYPLRCYESGRIIKPKYDDLFAIHYASSDSEPMFKEIRFNDLKVLFELKFYNESICKQWRKDLKKKWLEDSITNYVRNQCLENEYKRKQKDDDLTLFF